MALDWAVHRHLWRGQALYIRSLFEANRNIIDVRKQRVAHLPSSEPAMNLDPDQPIVNKIGIAERDGEAAGQMEAPRSLLSPHSPGWYVISIRPS
jgi:hypothetical protein